MLIADRRWYEATPAAVIAAPQLGSGQVHPSPSQSQTYQLHPLLSAHLLGVGDVLLEPSPRSSSCQAG